MRRRIAVPAVAAGAVLAWVATEVGAAGRGLLEAVGWPAKGPPTLAKRTLVRAADGRYYGLQWLLQTSWSSTAPASTT